MVLELVKNAESIKKKFSERITYWDDMMNSSDERIERDRSVMERDYSIQLLVLSNDERSDIHKILQLYNAESITHTELTHELGNIREKYIPIKEEILNAKAEALSEIELKYDNWMPDIIDNLMSSRHPIDANIAIVWNSDTEHYDVVSTTTFSTTIQPIITGLVTAPTEIQLSWKSPVSIDNLLVSGYKIEVKADDQSYVVLVDDTGNRNTSYTHTDLISGEFYTYRISAITDVEVSVPSNEIRASTATTTFEMSKKLYNLLDK